MPKIKIFSTHACPYCKMLKSWFNDKKIPYDNIYVDDNQAGMEEMMKISDGHMGVPFTLIIKDDGSKVKIAGFNKLKLQQTLKLNNINDNA